MIAMLAQTQQTTDAGYFTLLVWLMLLICSIAVGIDAKRIGARKGLLPGFFNVGPIGWAVSTFLLWIVAFPGYMLKRRDIIDAVAAERVPAPSPPQHGLAQPWTQPVPTTQAFTYSPPPAAYPPAQPSPPPPALPPAGWMKDPEASDSLRWWDGQQWTEHRTPIA